MAETETTPSPRPRAVRHIFTDADGQKLTLDKTYKKQWKDALRHHHGVQEGKGCVYTPINIHNPVGDTPLSPGPHSPICHACGLFEHESVNPFLQFTGSSDPLVTIVFDSVSGKEDREGGIASDGPARMFKKMVDAFAEETHVAVEDIRFVALTRCANRLPKPVNYKTKGQHCKVFFMQDLRRHPPKMIIPVGSAALGLLCHKSNAYDWGGRVLTWRGWPDDWLVEPDYVKPRQVTVGDDKQQVTVLGHPLLGAPPGPEHRCVLYPMQAPHVIYAFQNSNITQRWKDQLKHGLKLARKGVKPPDYVLPHYRILTDCESVADALWKLVERPGTLVAFDTETEGLHPFHGQKIVFMMFRYTDPDTQEPVAFGFPWDYAEDPVRGPASPLLNDLETLRPYVLKALTVSIVVGHNTSFDALFAYKALTLPEDMEPLDADGAIRNEWREAQMVLNGLADAFAYDTWHMAYTRRQQRGSLGLEVIAYDFAPALAGYEEDFTLLIDLERELLSPEAGGHYARCPLDKWDTHLKPYVLGDVEVCYQARDALQAKLDKSARYTIPLAHTQHRGAFRHFQPPGRDWLYANIMSPAARMLTKIMGRGMTIDEKALSSLELHMPKAIHSEIEKMKQVGNGAVTDYIAEMEAQDDHKDDPEKRWEFDLEKKEQLREVLFNRLKLKVQRLTKTGRKIYGEEPEEWDVKIRAAIRAKEPAIGEKEMVEKVEKTLLSYAALDKFTLNKLAVDHKEVRPLQDYRKLHKLYTTYVRPLRNAQSALDKKARTRAQHLCPDGCIHAQFMLTGTRGGRLSCRNPNLQQLPKEGMKYESVDLQVKKMYRSRFGQRGCLYGADFSQIELRLLAACSGDASMVDAYFKNIDLHTLTTSRIFNLSYDNFSKDHMQWLEKNGRAKEAKELKLSRDIGKTVNFLTGYGGGGFGLQTVLANRQVYKQLDWCENLVKAFFESYPAVRDFLSFYKRFIKETEVAVSLFGRVRVFEEVSGGDKEAESKALRAGCNHLIQSTASDMMLVCLVVIEQMMRDARLDSMLISTVHDSLVIDAIREELPQVHEIVDLVLNNMPDVFKTYLGEDYDTSWMIVPFAGDSEVGHNYGEMRAVPTEGAVDWDKLLDDRK